MKTGRPIHKKKIDAVVKATTKLAKVIGRYFADVEIEMRAGEELVVQAALLPLADGLPLHRLPLTVAAAPLNAADLNLTATEGAPPRDVPVHQLLVNEHLAIAIACNCRMAPPQYYELEEEGMAVVEPW